MYAPQSGQSCTTSKQSSMQHGMQQHKTNPNSIKAMPEIIGTIPGFIEVLVWTLELHCGHITKIGSGPNIFFNRLTSS